MPLLDPGLARSGLIDRQNSPVALFFAIERLDGIGHGLDRIQRDKGEASGSTGFAVARDVHVGYFAVVRKQGSQVLLACVEGQVSYIHFHDYRWFARCVVVDCSR